MRFGESCAQHFIKYRGDKVDKRLYAGFVFKFMWMFLFVVHFLFCGMTVFASEDFTDTELENIEHNQKQVIIEFDVLSEEERRFIINKSDKPLMEELIKVMPKTLNVVLSNGDSANLDVSWYCVGDDFDSSDSFYFQFSPQWNESEFSILEEMDVITDVPYISIFLTDDGNASGMAATNIENETEIYNFLKKEMGLNTAAACGVLANLYKESAFNPNAMGDYGTSYGICQWHNSRWTSMQNWCDDNDYDWKTLNGQLNYLKFELSKNDSNYLWNGKTIGDYIASVENTAQGAYDAAYYWCYYFEVPANREATSKTRGNLAKDTYWPEYASDPEYDKEEDKMPSTFTDVESDKWYYDSVEWVYKNGLLTGTSETKFSPNDPMTRGMLVTVFYRKEGRPIAPLTKVYPDVLRGKYYVISIDWATAVGIVSGYSNGNFGPEDSITREQLAKVLFQYAKFKGYDVEASADLSEFSDASNVSKYAEKYIKWTVAEGLIKGSNGRLNPKGEATRAEISAIIKRFVERYE